MLYILSVLLICLNCSDPKVDQVVEDNFYIKLKDNNQSIIKSTYYGGKFSIYYETNIEETLYRKINATVDGSNSSWCRVSMDRAQSKLDISVDNNTDVSSREATIKLSSDDVVLSIVLKQEGYVSTEIEPEYKKINILSGWSPNYLDEKTKIEKAFDGDPATYFNAKSGEAAFPYDIKFVLNTTESINHLIYYPRSDNGTRWGQFGVFEVWYNTSSSEEYIKAGEFDFEEELNNPTTAFFDTPIVAPKEILIKVFSGYNKRVSIGEIEFYSESEISFDYKSIFKDLTCSELKPEITINDIDKISIPFYKNLATKLFQGEYDGEYRVQLYRPYQHPTIHASKLKTGKYSLQDNPTGIYYNNLDESLIVFVDELKGRKVSLNIVDYSESANGGITYPLSQGLNILKPSKKGLVYILYHVDDDYSLNPTKSEEIKKIELESIKIHVATGLVNGYFDIRKNNNSDWQSIRDNAVSNEIDVLGLHSHVVWSVADYKDYNTNIVQMTTYIDNLVKQQHEFMGLYHHNRLFKNRQFMRIDYFVPAAYATDYRTVYKNSGYKEVFCSEDGFKRRMWVIGHEVGHVNQTRPGIKWHGTTEVTNNLYALYNQEQVHGFARRLTTGNGSQGYSNNGNDGYRAAFEKIIDAKRDWYIGGEDWNNNHITRLAPFWQLYLYLVQIEGQEHFYHDLFEYFRINASPATPGLQILDFVRVVCNISKTNLLDFFEQWGMLRPMDLFIDDYGVKNIVLTQTEIDNLKSEIQSKGYPKPRIEVHTVTDENYKQFIK